MHGIRSRFGFRGLMLVVIMERVLQLFELRRFDKRFGACFFRFRLIFAFRLRFFVLGFGKLFGECAHFIVGKAPAILGTDLCCFRKFAFGLTRSDFRLDDRQ